MEPSSVEDGNAGSFLVMIFQESCFNGAVLS